MLEDLPTDEERRAQHRARAEFQDMLANLSGFDPRKAEMLRMWFGLEGRREHTMTDIAQHFEVSRERVLQILSKVFRDLKLAKRAQA